jgi:succinylglutamate desuccinylase
MKILLNILTHGDEQIGLRVAREIRKLKIAPKTLTIHVANKKAYLARKRYIDQDLNRSFPGKKQGNHEERLAYKLSRLVKKFDLVIDIHSTKSDLKDALIVTKLDAETLRCVKVISPKYLLLMRATTNNALISNAKIGLAFEYGKDNNLAAAKKVVRDLGRLFVSLGIITVLQKSRSGPTQYFEVLKAAKKPKGYRLLKTIKNYKLVHKGDVYARSGKNVLTAEEDFYPILFGDNTYQEYFGFKAKGMRL